MKPLRHARSKIQNELGWEEDHNPSNTTTVAMTSGVGAERGKVMPSATSAEIKLRYVLGQRTDPNNPRMFRICEHTRALRCSAYPYHPRSSSYHSSRSWHPHDASIRANYILPLIQRRVGS